MMILEMENNAIFSSYNPGAFEIIWLKDLLLLFEYIIRFFVFFDINYLFFYNFVRLFSNLDYIYIHILKDKKNELKKDFLLQFFQYMFLYNLLEFQRF